MRGPRWHRWIFSDVLLPFAVTRLALLLAAQAALTARPVAAGVTYGTWADPSPHQWINALTRWDGRWYLSIAQQGYHFEEGQWSNTAFSPLLPLLMKGGALLLGRSDDEAYLLAGIVAANVALIGAAAYLVALVRRDFHAEVARWASWCLFLFPSSFYLSAVYPHSLLLLLAAGAFYYARSGRWLLAGAAAALAVFARPYGVVLVVPLAVEYLAQSGFSVRNVGRGWLSLGLVPAAYAVWIAMLAATTGDPLMFLRSSSAWEKVLTPQWQTLAGYLNGPLVLVSTRRSALDLVFVLFLAALVVYAWRRLPMSQALYATLGVVIATAWGTFGGAMRYATELFPLYVALALACRDPWLRRAYLLTAPAMGLVGMVGFARGWDYLGY